MLLRVVIVSRNKSIYTRSLHMVLHMQQYAKNLGLQLSLEFVDDNETDKVNVLKNGLKNSDRFMWVDYGVGISQDTLQSVFLKIPNCVDGLVFPAPVKDVINWDTFENEVKKNTNEPLGQVALEFDTEVGKNQLIPGIVYNVTKTKPQVWLCDSKKVFKKLKNIESLKLMSDFFSKSKTRWGAVVNTTVTTYFTHECIGNIMNIPNVKVA